MKKQTKRISLGALALAAVCAMTAGGVLPMTKKAAVAKADSPNTCQEFMMGAWVNFYNFNTKPYQEQIAEMSQAGVNWMISTEVMTPGGAGMHVYHNVPLSDINEACKDYNLYFNMPTQGYSPSEAIERVEKENLTNALSYYVKDEPSAAQIPSVAEAFNQYKDLDTQRFPYVNLFPSYAGATNLGGTYYDYVSNWVNTVGAENMEYLSYDHYPFTQGEEVRSTYFSDMETVRKVAYENGRIKTMACPQSGQWNGMRMPTADELTWNVNSYLAYGFKGLTHFCWVSPGYVAPENGGEGYRDHVIDEYGNKTELYEPASILNWKTRQLGKVLMNIDVKHAYHTAKIPMGAEELPSNFLLQPANENDDFVYSIAYEKGTEAPYLLVFNKALSGEEKEYSFRIDTATGVSSLREFRVTDYTMDTLPDPTDPSTLTGPEEVDIDVTSGKFSATFKPGEIRAYKLMGDDIHIMEELSVPVSSIKSGVYSGPQELRFTTGDVGAEIYYTTDGSYPEVGSENTYLYDGEPIKLGSWDEMETHTFRAVSVYGKEYSKVLDLDLVITGGTYNAAKGVLPKFYTLDLSQEMGFVGFNYSTTDIKLITDGSYDPWASCLATDGGLGWAVLDLGSELKINRINFSFWHEWLFTKVDIRVATKADFSDAVSVFKRDSYTNVPTVGDSVFFETMPARYVMVTNDGGGEGWRSVFTEIEVFTAYDGGVDLISDTENWANINGAAMKNNGSTIQDVEPYNQSTWNKAYSYNAKTYKNFVLDADMSIDVTDPSAWGFAGFQILRKKTTSNQDSPKGNGIVVGVEPKGRVLLWNQGEIGALDANIAGWAVGSTFNIKIVVFDGLITVAINGKAVMTENLPDWKDKEGYISFHTGLLPATLSSLRISELDDSFALPEKGETVDEVAHNKIAIERYVEETQVKAMLPDSVEITDTAGKTHTVAVEGWNSDDYDRTSTGNFTFYASLNREALSALNLANAYGARAEATVFVKSPKDTTGVDMLIAVAESLNEYEYEEESWRQMQLKVDAAKDIIADEFLGNTELNFAGSQLSTAIYSGLIYIGDVSGLEEALATAKAIDLTKYEAYSTALFTAALAEAEAYMQATFKTYDGVLAQVEALAAAEETLVEKATAGSDGFTGNAPTIETPVVEPADGCGSSLAGIGGAAIALAATGVAVVLKKKDEE